MARPDTRERILQAAERLFAERGFAETSVRAITAEADANLAAVHYHFSSKENLLEEVLLRRIGPIVRRRLELLDALERERGERPAPVEKILEALIRPLFELGPRSSGERRRLARLFGRAFLEESAPGSKRALRRLERAYRRFYAAFRKALPELPEETLHWRVHFIFKSLPSAFLNPMRFHPAGNCDLSGRAFSDARAQERLQREWIAFAAAGLRAAAPNREEEKEGGASP